MQVWNLLHTARWNIGPYIEPLVNTEMLGMVQEDRRRWSLATRWFDDIISPTDATDGTGDQLERVSSSWVQRRAFFEKRGSGINGPNLCLLARFIAFHAHIENLRGGDWKYLKRRCLSCCLANSVKTLNKWTIVWVKRLIWWKSTENITENIRYINVAVAFTHVYAFLSETPQILRENNRATFRPHRSHSTTYVDAAYCYRRSSVVRPSVCHDRQPRKKTAESTDMPFGFDSGESKEELL